MCCCHEYITDESLHRPSPLADLVAMLSANSNEGIAEYFLGDDGATDVDSSAADPEDAVAAMEAMLSTAASPSVDVEATTHDP
eukprot:SAG25_NODE_216_length_11681_cov_7.180021_4_plen_83_part_00